MPQISVSEAARRIKASPRDISDLFYQRKLATTCARSSPGDGSSPKTTST